MSALPPITHVCIPTSKPLTTICGKRSKPSSSRSAFAPWGSDLVEVAPPLGGEIEGEPQRTLRTSARYLAEQIRLGLAT